MTFTSYSKTLLSHEFLSSKLLPSVMCKHEYCWFVVCVTVCVSIYSLGLCSGDDTGINLGSMKERKEEDEDEEAFLPVGLLTV